MKVIPIAVIPGDGIGKEVVSEGVKCLQALAEIHGGLRFDFSWFSWGSERYLAEGAMMPSNGLDLLRDFRAVYLGAVGDPRVPDDVTLHGLLLPIKMGFDLYAGLRPVRLVEGVSSVLAGMNPGDIDVVVIRENTEGEYSNIGGIVGLHDHRLAVQSSVFSRHGIERIIRFAFSYARRYGRKKVTSITKSNAQRYGMVLWDTIFREISQEYPELQHESRLIDAACMEAVRNPGTYDVIVASNLFADILSDLTAGITGGMGLAPGGSFHPEDDSVPGLFDPVHGSAPDIAGKGIANPIAAILTAGMMLEFLGEEETADHLKRSVVRQLADRRVRTKDIGGNSTTQMVGDDMVRIIQHR
jgi:tartrate dehydrogenase/decarboxylase/D-malate dehydrogenase